MKHVADALKYTLILALYAWSLDLIPPNLGELTELISVILQILPCLKVQTFWGKWSEINHQELSGY